MVVTASALAIDSKPISRSTRSRSFRTKSRISRAVSECPSLLNAMRIVPVYQADPAEVFRCRTAYFFVRDAAQFSEPTRGVHYQRRLVPLAALRDRREIRRIRFDENSIERRFRRGLVNRRRFRIRDDSAEAQIKPEIERAPRVFRTS